MIRTLLEGTENIVQKWSLKEAKTPSRYSLSLSRKGFRLRLTWDMQLGSVFSPFNAGQLLVVQILQLKALFLSWTCFAVWAPGSFAVFLVKKNKIMWRTENSEKCIEGLLSFGRVPVSKRRRHLKRHLPLWTGRRAVRSYNSRAQLTSCDLCGDALACGPCGHAAPARLPRLAARLLLLCPALLLSLQPWPWFVSWRLHETLAFPKATRDCLVVIIRYYLCLENHCFSLYELGGG